MRQAAFRKASKGAQLSSAYSIPSPVKGWNARDSVASMDEQYALIMENVFPDTTEVMVRRGYTEHGTGFAMKIETLMPYNTPTGAEKLFAISDGEIFEVTGAGAIGAAVVTGLTNSRFEFVNFTNSSGDSYLCAFNGLDDGQYFDGTSWEIVNTAGPGLTFTGGLDPANVINVCVHKRRMWLVEKNTLSAWYLQADSVSGAAAEFNIGGIASKGGHLVAIGTWTIDAGAGIDDHLVMITSEGQVLVYQGTNPADAADFLLVGVWDIGQPIGRRCLHKFRGDVLVVTTEGVFPLSAAVTQGRTDARVALTDAISQAVSSSAALYKNNFGWQLCYFPEQNMLILNVPIEEGINQQQYVMNTVTGAWGGPFNAVWANCWAIFNEQPYFGGSDFVGKFWDGFDDAGANIIFSLQQAYSYLRSKGRLKQVKSVRPTILASGPFSVLMGVNVDFSRQELFGEITFSPAVFGIWDTGLWDSAIWGSNLDSYSDWQTVNAVGTSVSLRMKGEIGGIEYRYAASDVLYENGGVIA